jgi:hypothetical protein
VSSLQPRTQPPQQRPPRSIALANGGVALLILVVVAAFGVAVSQSAPPPIAAFAPDVQQHAHQKSLTGQQGAGALGASTPTGVPASPTPTAAGATHTPRPTPTQNALAGRPVSLRCYGSSPPHQTEDPQSPPCKQSFDGDNGGATGPGVSRDTIRVAWPQLSDGFPPPDNTTVVQDLATYVNAHFQFYGRKIQLVPLAVTGGSLGKATAQQQIADADKAASMGVFASIGYAPEGGTAYYYDNELARRGVVSVNSAPLLQTEAQLAATQYTWSTVPGYDRVEANLGNLYCHQLKGAQPAYAGPPTPPAQSWGPRKVAVYYETTTNNIAIDAQPLVDTLSACGVQVTAQALTDSSSATTAAVNDMQQHGVTTVACLCAPGQLGNLMKSATNQAFFPEWLVTNEQFLTQDVSSEASYPNEHQGHIIGIDFNNEVLDPQNEFWYRAVREVDPSFAYQQTSQDQYGYYRYEELLLLADGIQQAGPRLTAESFQQGLYATRFGNDGHGAAPYYQAAVSFGPGKHSFYDDAAAVWYSAGAQSYTTNQGNTGSYCYSRGGQRSADWSQPPPPAFYDTSAACRGG